MDNFGIGFADLFDCIKRTIKIRAESAPKLSIINSTLYII